MKEGVNKKGLQTLTFAIFVIGLVILIYYAPSIAGFIINPNNQNENEILTFNLNQFLPLTTQLMINNNTFSLQALLQDVPVTNITIDDEIIFGYNVTNLIFNLSKFNLTPGYYNFTLIDNNTIIASKGVVINETVTDKEDIQKNDITKILKGNCSYTESYLTKTPENHTIEILNVTVHNKTLNKSVLNVLVEDNYALVTTGYYETINETKIYPILFFDYIFKLIKRIINHAPTLIKEIPNQTWYKNTNLTDIFNLNDFFTDPDNDPLTYFYIDIPNISVLINDGSVTFVPDKDFIGKRYLQFIANDSKALAYSNNITLSVIAKEWNLTPTEETIQLQAEINKPVKWIKKIKFFASTKNATVTLPKEVDLSNIKVRKVMDDFKEDISPEKIKIEKEQEEQGEQEKYFKIYSIVSSKKEPNSSDISLIIDDIVKELEIEYETPAPISSETTPIIENDKWIKIVNISSVLHYKQVLAYTDIKEAKKEQIHLYLLEEEINEPTNLYIFVKDKDNLTKETKRIEITNNPEFNLTFADTDNNGLVDKIYWQTDLSNKSFLVEVDLTIINVQSYPTLYGNWTVAFNTIGIADLTITAVEGTTFTEIPDNPDTVNDLEFLELKCGNNTLENFFLVDFDGNLIPYRVYKIIKRIEEIQKRLKELEDGK